MGKDTPTVSTSNFNMELLNTKELSEHVGCSIKVGSNIAIFGRRGTGKTEISKQEIQKGGYKEIYMNLSVYERTDMGGFPNILSNVDRSKAGNEFVDYLLPQAFHDMIYGDTEVVALLDEVDKADPSLWAPLLEFTQFHTINGRKLPNLKSVIMTGNLISEGGSRPSLPLLDRAEKYLVEADPTSWLNWAGKSGNIHASITSFLTDNPGDLFGSVDPEERYADCSPRGWTNASRILRAGEALNCDSNLLYRKVCGSIGKQSGLKYQLYFEHYQELLPMIDNLFKGKDVRKEYEKLAPSKSLVAAMIACSRLANQMDKSGKDSPPPALKHVGKFLSYVTYEAVLVAIRSQIQIQRMIDFNLDEHEDWKGTIDSIRKTIDS